MNIIINPPKTYVYMTKRELVGDSILDEGYYCITDLDDYMDRFVDLEKNGACQLLTDAEMQAVLEEQGVVEDDGLPGDGGEDKTLPEGQHEQTLPPQPERTEGQQPSTTLPAQPETAGSPNHAATNPKKTTKKKDKPEDKATQVVME